MSNLRANRVTTQPVFLYFNGSVPRRRITGRRGSPRLPVEVVPDFQDNLNAPLTPITSENRFWDGQEEGKHLETNAEPEDPIEPPQITSELAFQASSYDREVDFLVAFSHTPDQVALFKCLVPRCPKDNAVHPLFTLPRKVRLQIYGYCFPEEPRKITLAPQFVTGGVFSKNYFASPWVILAQVQGGLATSRAFRHELMAYFWTQYHFHITLSPFSGPKFSPLTFIWLPNYLGIIQKLSVEIDLTRFGGSLVTNSSELRQCEKKLEIMLTDIMMGLLNRPSGLTMNELHLMCRRWHSPKKEVIEDLQDREVSDGETTEKSTISNDEEKRSHSESESDSGFDSGFDSDSESEWNSIQQNSLTPQTPAEVLRITRVAIELRDLIQALRISGFPLEFASDLFVSIFGNQERSLKYTIPIEPAWPPMPEPVYIPTPPKPDSTTSPTAEANTSSTRAMSHSIQDIATLRRSRTIQTVEATSLRQSSSKSTTSTTSQPLSSMSLTVEAATSSRQSSTSSNQDPLGIEIENTISTLEVPTATQSKPPPIDTSYDFLDLKFRTNRSFIDEVDDGITEVQETPQIRLSNYIATPNSIESVERFPELDPNIATEGRIHSYSFPSPTLSSGTAIQHTISDSSTTPRRPVISDEEFVVEPSPRLQSPIHPSPHHSPARRFPLRTSSIKPSPIRCSSPGTINRMNELNEQDPAFLRTLNAMRSSRERCQSSDSNQNLFSTASNSTTTNVQTNIMGESNGSNLRKRYGGFFSKLTGRKNT